MILPRTIAVLAFCVFLAVSAAGAAGAGTESPTASARILFAARADAIRAASAKDGSAFAGFLSDLDSLETNVREAWDGVAEELDAIRLADFFAGANVLVGPVSRDPKTAAWSGILGLYNPWWDAILLLRLDDDLRVDLLSFLDGEAFRKTADSTAFGKGDSANGRPATGTVVPVGEPLSRALLRAQSKTTERFREDYPADGAAEKFQIPPPRYISRDLSTVKVRATLRRRLLRDFLASDDGGKAGIAAPAARAQNVLRHGDARSLGRHFPNPARQAFRDAFAKFPANVREGFSLYGYVPAKDGALFVFLNPAFPRLYATVAFPKNRESDPEAGSVAFEWYDLEQAREFPKACDSEQVR